MRTTLTLEEDVAERTRQIAHRLHKPFKTVVNEALRKGLDEVDNSRKPRPYRTKAHDMGLREGLSLDNIHDLLSQVEKEDYR
jgi:predicted transcriptional regulator